MTTRVAEAAIATAAALVVGAVGVVLAIDDRACSAIPDTSTQWRPTP